MRRSSPAGMNRPIDVSWIAIKTGYPSTQPDQHHVSGHESLVEAVGLDREDQGEGAAQHCAPHRDDL